MQQKNYDIYETDLIMIIIKTLCNVLSQIEFNYWILMSLTLTLLYIVVTNLNTIVHCCH